MGGNVKILLFARIRDQLGIDSVDIDKPSTVAELRLLQHMAEHQCVEAGNARLDLD